ncbi:MAG TPA: YggS family pyridoxal phosphate-dependent enzyme [Actinomycetota bacterium]
MSGVAENVAAVRERIETACRRAGRDPSAVRLVAVTKTVDPSLVQEAAEVGVEDFGENYVQELEGKRGAAPRARWHFLGRVQSNKAHRVAKLADMVQTVEPGRAWRRLASAAEDSPIPCLIQVDFTGERVGVEAAGARAFLDEVVAAGGLDAHGLMTVPPLGEDPRPYFVRLRELRDELRERHPGLSELSMGMSADYEEAVVEGATMVRVGTAIFGPRP